MPPLYDPFSKGPMPAAFGGKGNFPPGLPRSLQDLFTGMEGLRGGGFGGPMPAILPPGWKPGMTHNYTDPFAPGGPGAAGYTFGDIDTGAIGEGGLPIGEGGSILPGSEGGLPIGTGGPPLYQPPGADFGGPYGISDMMDQGLHPGFGPRRRRLPGGYNAVRIAGNQKG